MFVAPGGIITSIGATVPTFADVSTLFASMSGFNSKTASSLKTNPTFPVIKFLNESNSLMAFPNLARSS